MKKVLSKLTYMKKVLSITDLSTKLYQEATSQCCAESCVIHHGVVSLKNQVSCSTKSQQWMDSLFFVCVYYHTLACLVSNSWVLDYRLFKESFWHISCSSTATWSKSCCWKPPWISGTHPNTIFCVSAVLLILACNSTVTKQGKLFKVHKQESKSVPS